MKDLKEIVSLLMIAKGCYDEKAIQERLRAGISDNEDDAIINIGFKSRCISEDEIEREIAFEIFRGQFRSREDFDFFIKNLTLSDHQTYFELTHFYFFWCKRPKLANVSESFRFLAVVSLIEALATENNHKEFFDWFRSEASEDIKSQKAGSLEANLEFLWSEYKKKHGAYRKFYYFLKDYLSDADKQHLIQSFKFFNSNGQIIPNDSNSLNRIAKLLYTMRSDFVHTASHITFSTQNFPTLHKVGNKDLITKCSIEDFMGLFENGFIEFFKKRTPTP